MTLFPTRSSLPKVLPLKRLLAISLSAISLTSAPLIASAGALVHDYGDPNASRLWRQLAALERKESSEVVRIMQLGDSHTGGDYFTQAYREQMQKRFGNAGIGWLSPGYIKNQRSAQVLMRMNGNWKTRVSRNNPENFPLGGFANQPDPGASIEIVPKQPLFGLQRVTIWNRRINDEASGGWKLSFPDGEVRDLLPPLAYNWQSTYVMGSAIDLNSFTLRAENNPPELGAIIIDTLAPGVTVDSLGIVGATQRVIARWQTDAVRDQLQWRRPSLIVLAYGTNEAFDPNPDFDLYKQELQNTIRQLRAAAPDAAILLIGAPNSAKKKGAGENVGCRYRLPAGLKTVQNIQQDVAISEHLLFWSWESAMGGRCSMQRFVDANPPLGRPDYVHFTEEGYAQGGNAFFEALMQKYQKSRPKR